MRALKRWSTRLFNFSVGRRGDDRLREEMEAHLTAQTEENIRAGMAPAEARRQARLKFGAVDAVREDYRAEAGLPWVENLLRDVWYALRVLRKSPAFTSIAFLTLTLGIGANVVVFSIINAVLLQPLAVSDPANLYQLRHQQWMIGRLLTTSYPALLDFQQRNTSFSDLAGVYGYSTARLTWRNWTFKLHGDGVTGNYFDLLGVQPELGRFFHIVDENGRGSAPYVVLSDALWRNAFHADPSIVGATVHLDNDAALVLGVAPPRFHGAERIVWPDYWRPLVNDRHDSLTNRRAVGVTVLGRLKPGVTAQWATANLNAIAAQLGREYPESDDGQPLRLIHPGLLGDEGDIIREALYSLTLLALLVLAAACANLATLFAARAADRSRELALRMALGSSRLRIVTQLLTEAVLIALFSGAAGLASARLLLGILNRSQPFLGSVTVSLDMHVYLAGVAFAMGSALLFGIGPAWQTGRSSPLQTIKSVPANAKQLRRFAMRDLLMGAQIAICTLLVTASLVAARGMVRALHVPLGIEPHGAMLTDLDNPSADQTRALLEAVRGVPGVTAAGAINRTPFTGGIRGVPVFRPGTTEFKLNNSVLAPYVYQMSPGYLEAAGTRLLSGRDVSWHDTATTPYVAVVNQTFVRKMWGGTPAIGQHFIVRGNLTQVVGVVEDGKYYSLDESPMPAAYLAVSQSEVGESVMVIRSRRTASEMAPALQRTLGGGETNQPIGVQNWSEALDDELMPARAATVSLGVMGLLAAMLAVTGIFGMAAYSVSKRKKELGIRVALGATKTQVMAAALTRPIVLLGVGSALGLLLGLASTKLLAHIVYQANPGEPFVMGGAALTMALLGLAASAVPARRALAVDPAKLMREE